MALVRLNNYLRTKRKHSGLSQSDVSFLVRLKDKSDLSRYERHLRRPSLRTAGESVSDLFAGLSDCVAKDTRNRMKTLQTRFRARTGPKSSGNRIMQKLQWISLRLLEKPNFQLV